MPIYDYDCPVCGLFSLSRPLSNRNLPAHCPACESAAELVISAPHLSLMSALLRSALYRNEKSRHEPAVVSRHPCGAGCGCVSPRPARTKSTRTVDLGKIGKFEAAGKRKRPWMLGH